MNKKHYKNRNSSGKCPCDICGDKIFLDCHHINGRKIKNPNHDSNLANICPSCHRSIHMGLIVIEKWAMTDEGRKLFWHSVNDISFTGEDANPHII